MFSYKQLKGNYDNQAIHQSLYSADVRIDKPLIFTIYKSVIRN